MIQRIQTIFLLVVVAALITFNFFPYWESQPNEDGASHVLMPYAYLVLEGEASTPAFGLFSVVAGLSILAAVIGIIEIFQFKNRMTQMKIGALNSVIMTAVLGLMTYFVLDIQKSFAGSFGTGLFILAIAMIFNIMARRAIQKDEKLVKSMDRLR